MNKDELGRYGEEFAARHLETEGYEILDRNWRVPIGEIDIVARDGRELVVVEVKTRTSTRYGTPIEAITPEKARRLRRLAVAWAKAHDARPARIRVDAVGIVAPRDQPLSLRHVRAVA